MEYGKNDGSINTAPDDFYWRNLLTMNKKLNDSFMDSRLLKSNAKFTHHERPQSKVELKEVKIFYSKPYPASPPATSKSATVTSSHYPVLTGCSPTTELFLLDEARKATETDLCDRHSYYCPLLPH